MNRTFLLATAFATVMAGVALPSHAGNWPELLPIVSPQYHGGGSTYPYPGYDDNDDDYYERRISCWEGSREVRQAGFRNVRPLRCSGDIYRYNAIRRGHIWTVRVNPWSGRIVSIRPVRYY